MDTNMKRRIFLKGSLAASAIGVALGAGLLAPKAVLAAWSEAAFTAKKMPDALNALFGTDMLEESGSIAIKAPDIAENGAVVPITVSAEMANVESISIIAANNPVPMIASFNLGEGGVPFVSTRIKMGKSGDVVAVIKADGKLYTAKKGVKVTIGGCGG
jgi:sulfur-oxidizing protein SoxY